MQEFEVNLEVAPGCMARVGVSEKTYLYELAKQCQNNYADPIMLAVVDGRLRESRRSEERRGGKECHRVCRSRWSPDQ